MKIKERVATMQNLIVLAGVACGLNLTVYDGKIGFVDQEQRKIVALWEPEYKASDIDKGKEGGE